MSRPAAAGQEILVVDCDEQVLRGLERLLTRVGLIVTSTTDPVRARDQLLNKFFAVALLDVDTPTPGGGLELLQFSRDKSALTAVVMMTARKTFDLAVKAFRGGAIDVVLKEPDVVPYLRERVLDAATELKSASERNTLLEEVSESHEDFLRKMRELSRQLLDMEDKILGRVQPGESEGGREEKLDVVNVVLVDDDPGAVPQLQDVLPAAEGWRFRPALTGGEALDVVSQTRPHIVMVKEQLPDLPGSMVVKTVKSAASDAVTLLYSPPGRGGLSGELKMVEGSRIMNLIPKFNDHRQLVAPLQEIREALRQKTRERRYLQAFRQSNFEFLQRYNSLKQRLLAELARHKK
ncbi:MAG TPA: response regulator [Polyangia bacterium]|nr:response regulator [Polyangia bacterium]